MSFILNAAGDYPGLITKDLNLEHILTIQMRTFYKPELSGHEHISDTHVNPVATQKPFNVKFFIRQLMRQF